MYSVCYLDLAMLSTSLKVCVSYVLKISLFSIYLHTCMYLYIYVRISVSITNAPPLPLPPPQQVYVRWWCARMPRAKWVSASLQRARESLSHTSSPDHLLPWPACASEIKFCRSVCKNTPDRPVKIEGAFEKFVSSCRNILKE